MSARKSSRVAAWAARLSRWPRVVRMALVAVIALLFAALASQVTGLLVGPAAHTEVSAGSTVVIVAAVAGFLTYLLGWWVLVGFGLEPHPELGARAVSFVIFGVLVALVLVVWALVGTIIAMLPPEVPI
jgi:uncharacterized membrane-anchored protein